MRNDGLVDPDEALLERRFQFEFARLPSKRLGVEADHLSWWAVLIMAQLGIKHPASVDTEMARIAEVLLRQVQAQIAPLGALSIVAERGWRGDQEPELEEPPPQIITP